MQNQPLRISKPVCLSTIISFFDLLIGQVLYLPYMQFFNVISCLRHQQNSFVRRWRLCSCPLIKFLHDWITTQRCRTLFYPFHMPRTLFTPCDIFLLQILPSHFIFSCFLMPIFVNTPNLDYSITKGPNFMILIPMLF